MYVGSATFLTTEAILLLHSAYHATFQYPSLTSVTSIKQVSLGTLSGKSFLARIAGVKRQRCFVLHQHRVPHDVFITCLAGYVGLNRTQVQLGL